MYTYILTTTTSTPSMILKQYEKLKILIKKTTKQNIKANNLTFLKYDTSNEITILLLKTYRESINKEIAKKFLRLNDEDIEACYFKGLQSLFNSIAEDRFQFKDEKSVKNYLFISCKGNATRLIKNKNKSFFSIDHFLLFSDVNHQDEIDQSEYKNMIIAAKKAFEEELCLDCKKLIKFFYLKEKNHKQIVKLMPEIKNVKNSSAKTNRCLNKLRIKALAIFRKLENIN